MAGKPTIIVASNNIDSVEAVAKLLYNDYRLLLVKSERETFAALKTSNKVNAIIIAYDFSNNIYEFVAAVKESTESNPIAILVSITNDETNNMDELILAGADDVIVKPYNAKLVNNRVNNIIEGVMRSNQRSEFDSLTGIYSREAFFSHTLEMLQLNFDKKYSIICVDINRFKMINELFGNNIGDEILKNIAAKLRKIVTGIGVCARMESDHFTICVERGKVNLENMLFDIQSCFSKKYGDFDFAAYMGVYEVDDITVSVNLMCDRANLALDKIKGNYLNRIAYYDDELRSQLLIEQEITTEMKDALVSGQFKMYLQPIYSTNTSLPVSAEALVRWIHPSKGIIPPSVFVPLFEKNGFISKMDEYIWEQAVRYIAELRDSGIEPVPISVNVSRADLYNPNIVEDMTALVNKYNVSPDMLKIEITESAYVDNAYLILSMVDKFKKCGFIVLMDDFGSGFPSLNMLKDLAIDILKIDMKFIDEVNSSDRAANIMTSIVRMAKWLNIEVLVEGVEDGDQVSFLKSIGCDYIQGYYYAKPMPTAEFTQLIAEKGDNSRFENTRTDKLFQDFDKILSTGWGDNILLSGLLGAVAMYEKHGSKLESVRVNDSYYQLMGCTPSTVQSSGCFNFTNTLGDGRERLKEKCNAARDNAVVEECMISCLRQDGSRIWVNIKIKFIGSKGDRDVYLFSFDDVTSVQMDNMQNDKRRYLEALSSSFRDMVEIDYLKNLAYFLNTKDGGSTLKDDFADTAIEEWLVNEVVSSDRARVRDFFSFDGFDKMKINDTRSIIYKQNTDGKLHWLETILIKTSGGTVIVCSRDIEHLWQEIELRTPEIIAGREQIASYLVREMNKFINDIPIGVFIYRIDGGLRLDISNEMAKKMLGINEDINMCNLEERVNEITGYNFGEYIVDKTKENFDEDFAVSVTKINGEKPIWLRSYSRFIKSSDNKEMCYVVFGDITSQMLQEKEIHSQYELIKMVSDVSDLVFFNYNYETSVLKYSLRLPNGTREERVVPNYLEYMKNGSMMIHPASYEAFMTTIKNAITDKPLEFLADLYGSGYRWYRADVYALKEDDKLYSLFGKAEDIDAMHEQSVLSAAGSFKDESTPRTLCVYEFDVKANTTKILHEAEDLRERFYEPKIYASFKYMHPDDVDTVTNAKSIERYDEMLRNGETENRARFRILNLENEWVWVQLIEHLMKDGKVQKILGYVEVIDELKSLEMRAKVDMVSGLFNRATLISMIEQTLLTESEKKHALLFFDVDDFKTINDVYGHGEGDKLLRSIGDVFRRNFVDGDILGRLAGDEFMILIRNIGERGIDINKLAIDILTDISSVGTNNGWDETVTVSMGIAFYPKDGVTFGELYSATDKALYSAKASGKNCAVIYEPVEE